jgi:hypothetical protein
VTAEPDPRRPSRDGGEDDLGGGHREIGTVVLADAEEVEPELVGEDRLVDDVADDLGGRERPAGRVEGDVAEGVETQLELGCWSGYRGHGGLLSDRSFVRWFVDRSVGR